MNTTAATITLNNYSTANLAHIVYVSVRNSEGKLIEVLHVNDGRNVVKLADKALNAKGYFRSSGYSMVDGEMTAKAKF